MISVLGWSSALFTLLGAFLFVGISAHDITVARVGAAVLLFVLAACANIVANRSGWNHPKELYAILQFFGRVKARIRSWLPLRTAQEGQSEKKRAFRFVRPPIQLRIYL